MGERYDPVLGRSTSFFDGQISQVHVWDHVIPEESVPRLLEPDAPEFLAVPPVGVVVAWEGYMLNGAVTRQDPSQVCLGEDCDELASEMAGEGTYISNTG